MIPKRLLCILALAASPMAVSAGLIGDEVNVTVDGVFGTVISGTTTVGPGIELTGTDSLLRDYALNLTDLAFALTVSKPSSAGNFTAILDSIVIEGIDQEVLGVTFDAAASSAFSSGDPTSIDLSTPGRILIDFGGFASANTPATALSHRFVWNLELGGPIQASVSEPSALPMAALGLMGLAFARRRRLSSVKGVDPFGVAKLVA